MAIFTSVQSYRKSIRTRIRNLSKAADDSTAQATHFALLKGKQNAPQSSGKLAKSGRRFKRKKAQWSVLFGYKGDEGFAIGPWTNQQFVITPKLPRGKAARLLKTPAGQSIRYGDGRSGINWSARVNPWWDKTVAATQRKFRKDAVKRIRFALRS